MLLITTTPEVDDGTQTVTLGGSQFRVRLYWRERLYGWYMDVRESDDTAVFLGRRLSPGGDPFAGIRPENGPEGVFFVMGPDEYARADLGVSLLIYFIPDSEIPDPAGDEYTVTVAQ